MLVGEKNSVIRLNNRLARTKCQDEARRTFPWTGKKKKKQFQIDSNDHQNLWRENPHKPLRELQMS